MIGRVSEFVPFGAPASPVPKLDSRILAEILRTSAAKPAADDALVDVLQRSFSVALLDALSQRRPVSTSAVPVPNTAGDALQCSAEAARPAGSPVSRPPSATAATDTKAVTPRSTTAAAARPLPAEEEATIKAAAARAAIDPKFLQALRRTENGGPGREFGVLSVPAPTYQDQARVAADSVRRNIERFEATGGQAIDPVARRYTPEFIEFFSRRYAPVGAANDPSNLNQYHARNLIRLYAQNTPKA